MSDGLYIYDGVDPMLRDGDHGRDFHRLPIYGGVRGLHAALDQLLKERKTFTRVLWQTHGKAGSIGFRPGEDEGQLPVWSPQAGWRPPDEPQAIDYNSWKMQSFTDKGYDKLFPLPTKMYFDGCNVAEGDVGWKFLENAGKLFLHAGGSVIGWTSWGIHIFGHTVHLWGDARTVHFDPKGVVAGRTTTEKTERQRREERGSHGNRV